MAISLTGMHCCYAEVYILIQQVSHMNKNRKIQVLNLRTMNDIIKGNALSGVAIPSYVRFSSQGHQNIKKNGGE